MARELHALRDGGKGMLEMGTLAAERAQAINPHELSFVELVLAAADCSEDQGEIRDLIDHFMADEQIRARTLL